MKKLMKVEGMRCGGCEGRLKRILEALPQVEKAEASYQNGTVEVTLTAEISDELLKQTVESCGFTFRGIE
ncbi:MAG: heavy-metal-associated domain-containing protein [Clostridia bacterium]|nr:heavy-metal-associated domain-containing protein [Clostridia bacterium]